MRCLSLEDSSDTRNGGILRPIVDADCGFSGVNFFARGSVSRGTKYEMQSFMTENVWLANVRTMVWVMTAGALVACGGSGGRTPSSTTNGSPTESQTTTQNTVESLETPQVACPDAPSLIDTAATGNVVGTGTPASCTASALEAAIAQGGTVTFNCGAEPHTINTSSELQVDRDLVLDGGGLITLDAADQHRIMSIGGNFESTSPAVVVQRMSFSHGKSSNTGDDTVSGGGAIYRKGGTLTVLDSQFTNNSAPASGQDIAGGAIYSFGGGETTISGSAFSGNSASNGGALGNLQNDLTIINSLFVTNAATGTGGNPGNGGNGGAIYIDGVSQTVTMCGTQIASNTGNAYGGGLFRVSNNLEGSQTIESSTIDGNSLGSGITTLGGGAYLQGVDITISNSTVSRNSAEQSGGLFVGPGSTLNMVNSTIAENESINSLAGGMSIHDGVTGLIKNVTFANNRANDSDSFAAATVGGTGVVLQNTIIDGHEVGNGYNPISCLSSFIEGTGNLQFPMARAGGGSDDPGSLCSRDVLVSDSLLGPLSDNGGETLTLLPGSGSPAIGQGSDCPATDQRGMPRSEPCTAGAVEVSQ